MPLADFSLRVLNTWPLLRNEAASSRGHHQPLSRRANLANLADIAPIQIHLAADQLEKTRAGGINLSQDLLLASEIEKIRVLVFDRKLYAAGSVTVAAPK